MTLNFFSALFTEELNVDYNVLNDPNQEQMDTNNNAPKSILPPPIIIKGVLTS